MCFLQLYVCLYIIMEDKLLANCIVIIAIEHSHVYTSYIACVHILSHVWLLWEGLYAVVLLSAHRASCLPFLHGDDLYSTVH